MRISADKMLNLDLSLLSNNTEMDKLNLTDLELSTLLKKLLENSQNHSAANSTEAIPSCEECKFLMQNIVLEYAQNYHFYIAIFTCVFGTIANLLNIAVLTRKDMACTPINRILTGLAVAEMMIMVEYCSFAYYYYVELPGKFDFPYWGAVFMLVHTHFTQVLHTISICLTLTLAVWRYVAIGFPDKNHIYCSESRCTSAICLSYALPIILCSPNYFVFSIKSTRIVEDGKEYILYHTSLSEVAHNSETYLVFNFWMYAVVIKLIPCAILTFISFWLIRTLFTAKKRKENLKNYNVCIQEKDKTKHKGERRADRTTRMLVAVLLLFLITEFPQGIFGLLIGLKGKCFFLKCYQNFGAMMDILALLNGSINFILYCCMNRNFRTHFGQLFKHKILAKWVPPTHSEAQSTFL